MKKIIALALVLVMMTATLAMFASCGQDTNENVLICGVTPFEKMNDKDENGNYTSGFETEFAIEVGKLLGMEVKFQEIDWEQKYSELASGAINCIWNGFTANSADNGTPRSELVDFTYGYMLNQQCVVIKVDNKDIYKTEADLVGKTAGVEGGSAGESYAVTAVGENGKIEKYPAQNKSFLEVKTGAVDFAVVDIVLAKNICGKGDFTDLMIVDTIQLASEIYAVGFEKGSPLTAKVNEAIETLFENGKIMELATKYGFENTVELIKEIK